MTITVAGNKKDVQRTYSAQLVIDENVENTHSTLQ